MKKIYTFPVIIKKIYDGDTLYVDIDLGFNTWLKDMPVRINGINTPEIRTLNKLEKEAGIRVTEYVRQILPIGSEATLISKGIENLNEKIKKGKYGRILGDIVIENEIELADLLLEMKYAVPYNGGKKEVMTEEFLINIIHKDNDEKI